MLWVVQLLSRPYDYGYMLEVRHILREGNHFADHLANLAQNGIDGLIHLHNPLPLFLADVLRHGRIRF
ncbi:hypothetical protein Goari_017888 [Gossypium aridum]|uniref:Uncharacterized protein n=1 Tax=Gossypium aridum TaxID=34290 RepID=A0A7J8WMX6_GOSAI|nr:hypothetical protein [Gossypium aridum]